MFQKWIFFGNCYNRFWLQIFSAERHTDACSPRILLLLAFFAVCPVYGVTDQPWPLRHALDSARFNMFLAVWHALFSGALVSAACMGSWSLTALFVIMSPFHRRIPMHPWRSQGYSCACTTLTRDCTSSRTSTCSKCEVWLARRWLHAHEVR